jgi:hypothetical protein
MEALRDYLCMRGPVLQEWVCELDFRNESSFTKTQILAEENNNRGETKSKNKL